MSAGSSRRPPVAVTRITEEVLAECVDAGLLEPTWEDLERKNRELQESQALIDGVLAAMSDILIVSDAGGRIRKVNRAVLDLTGFVEADLVGQPVGRLFRVDCPAALGLWDGRHDCPQTHRRALQECEVRLRGRDGRETEPVTLRCEARHDAVGGSGGMVIIGRPVGELRRAYEALNRAHGDLMTAQQRLLQTEKLASIGRLVAGVAHELNNPVSFVYGNMQALRRYGERLEHYVAALHQSPAAADIADRRAELRIDQTLRDLPSLIDGTVEGAERIRDIVRSLVSLSFRDGPGREPVDLAAVARTAAQWTGGEARRSVDLRLDLPERMIVSGKAGRLHQLLVNLLQNAVDAVAAVPDPAIVVTGTLDGDTAVLAVRDNGPGIDNAVLTRIFDPFFTTKPVGQGTGLGLWVCYEIVQDHGGRIEAANHPEGGAVFTLRLPLPG